MLGLSQFKTEFGFMCFRPIGCLLAATFVLTAPAEAAPALGAVVSAGSAAGPVFIPAGVPLLLGTLAALALARAGARG